MAFPWMRRTWLVAAAATALLLAACGGGTVNSKLSPARVIAFGDGMAELGQDRTCGNATCRYTVNDGTVNNWTEYVANSYDKALTPSRLGGLSYAYGNARIVATPDAAGNSATPTVQQQIDTFLASNSIGSDDLILVSAGTADVVTQARITLENGQTSDQANANAEQAGRDLATQVKRLVSAGAKHVVVAGTYNLGRSPWAHDLGTDSLLQPLSTSFNNGLLVSLVDQGANVLYVDFALYFNTQTSNGSNVTNYTGYVCTSVDAGPGIGTGNGQVNSKLCTTSTLLAGADYNNYLFADRVYPTPRGHQLFGDYARGRIQDRW